MKFKEDQANVLYEKLRVAEAQKQKLQDLKLSCKTCSKVR